MSTKSTSGRISEKLKRLNEKRNLILLALKINEDDISVAEIAQKIADISRVDRSYLRLHLSETGKRKFDWALGKILSRRRKELNKAILEQNAGLYLSQFGWLEKLELMDVKSKEAERLIKKNVRSDVCLGELSRDFVDMVGSVNSSWSSDIRLLGIAEEMRPCEKQAINDIYLEAIFSGDPKQVLTDLRKNLSVLPAYNDFCEDDFLFKAIKRQVVKLVGIQEEDFIISCYGGKIDMNEKSNNIIATALLASSPKVAYTISILNFFQSLDAIDEDKNPIKYIFESHSVTVEYLRMLARRGVVEIEKLDYTGKVDLKEYYVTLGNSPRTRPLKTYEVVFTKKRDLYVGDAKWLMGKMDALGIPGWEMFLGFDENFKMSAYLSSYSIRRNISNGTFDENLARMKEAYSKMTSQESEQISEQSRGKTMKMKKISSSKK
ncbi:MAG TPA: hypothetical protein DCY94_03220 [Firmicutes bacterium]|nr:hypothetical protein [Bacillota bacterium]